MADRVENAELSLFLTWIDSRMADQQQPFSSSNRETNLIRNVKVENAYV
jgi:hypothetical protein